ncbi:hypothetical protein LINPERPRIM_LOCUS30554 [Linum perenne]
MVDSGKSKSSSDQGGKSWASVVGTDPNPDLQYFPPVVIDGVLQIPQSVLDFGYKELKKALVGQVIGDAPPLRVIQALANNLWGYEGFISVALLPSGLFLIEFPTQSLCDWVYSRLWHVHNQPLILRRWKADLEPVDIELVETPVWITLKGVPPPLCNHLGIGHLASQVGKPLSKFITVGTTVKVCVLAGIENDRPTLLVVNVAHKQHEVTVEYPEFRAYEKKTMGVGKNGNKEWRVKVPTTSNDTGDKQSKDADAAVSGSTGDKPADEVYIPETMSSGDKPSNEVHVPEIMSSGDKSPEVNTRGSDKEVQYSGPSASDNGEGNGSIPQISAEGKKRDSTPSKNVEADEEESFSVNGDMQDDIAIPRAFSPEFFPPFKRGGRRGKKR